MNTDTPKSKALKLNKGVAKGIICWINRIKPEFNLKNIKDLKTCEIFINLIQLILISIESELDEFYENFKNLQMNTIDDKFEFVHYVCKGLFNINGEIYIDKAKKGDEFELAKVRIKNNRLNNNFIVKKLLIFN